MEESLEPSIVECTLVSYHGDTDEVTGFYNGWGEARYQNGCLYEGTFKAGLFHGTGKYTWADSSQFEGEFVEGMICGRGKFIWASGSKYEGTVVDGKRHGTGQYTSAEGQLYDGEWVDGMRDGKGKMYYNADKSILYVGSWSKGLRNGHGIMRYASGNIYEGEWVDDKKCGRGVMTWKDVDEVYLGQWLDDQCDGFGEYIWADSSGKPGLKKFMCNMYRGEWKNGNRSGVGTFFYSDGSQYTGEWLSNQKDGSGVFVYPDGRLHYGFYAADRMLLNDAIPRESEAVTPQVRIYINDVLASICPGETEYSSAASKTIERLLLRYNSTIRQICKRYTDFGNAKRKQGTDNPPDSWEKLDKLFHTTRNIHKRFYTSTLGDFWRFCREFSIIGPHFNAYDVCQCLYELLQNRRITARELQIQQEESAMKLAIEAEMALAAPAAIISAKPSKKDLKKGSNTLPPAGVAKTKTTKAEGVPQEVKGEVVPEITKPPAPNPPKIPLKAMRPAHVDTLIAQTHLCSDHPLWMDPRYPLREYEFVELMVRCAIRSHLNNELIGVESVIYQVGTVDMVDASGRMIATSGLGNTLNGMNTMRTGSVKSRSGIDVANIVYAALAEKMHAITNNWTLIPSVVSNNYSTLVQQVLQKHSVALNEIWCTLQNGNKGAKINDVLKYILSLKDTTADFVKPAITHDCDLAKLLQTAYGSLLHNDPNQLVNNMTRLKDRMIFDDFVALLCVCASSDVWALSVDAPAQALENEEQKKDIRDSTGGTLSPSERQHSSAQVLAQRLGAWLETYKMAPPPSSDAVQIVDSPLATTAN